MLNPDRIGLEPVPQGPTAEWKAELGARRHPDDSVPKTDAFDWKHPAFKSDRLAGERKPPKISTPPSPKPKGGEALSHKAQLKAVMADDAIHIASKQPGYRNRYGGSVLYHKGKPIHSVPKLLPCTRPECDQVEKSLKQKFKQCTMCLTVYCSPTCQKLDWSAHKEGCKKRGYYEQRDKWEQETPGIPSVLFGYTEEYMALWDKWVATESMQTVLKHCNLDATALRKAMTTLPKSSSNPKPSEQTPDKDPEVTMRARDLKAAADALLKAADPSQSPNLTYGDLKAMFTPLVCSMFDSHPELLDFDDSKIEHQIDNVCLAKFKEMHKPFVIDDPSADILLFGIIGLEISRRKVQQDKKTSVLDGFRRLVRVMFRDHPGLLEDGGVDTCMAKFFELHGTFKDDEAVRIFLPLIVQGEIDKHRQTASDDE